MHSGYIWEKAEDEMVREHHWLNGHKFEQLWEVMDERIAWHAAFRGVTKSRSDLTTEQQQEQSCV